MAWSSARTCDPAAWRCFSNYELAAKITLLQRVRLLIHACILHAHEYEQACVKEVKLVHLLRGRTALRLDCNIKSYPIVEVSFFMFPFWNVWFRFILGFVQFTVGWAAISAPTSCEITQWLGKWVLILQNDATSNCRCAQEGSAIVIDEQVGRLPSGVPCNVRFPGWSVCLRLQEFPFAPLLLISSACL